MRRGEIKSSGARGPRSDGRNRVTLAFAAAYSLLMLAEQLRKPIRKAGGNLGMRVQ